MKKFTLLLAVLFSAQLGFGQLNSVVEAPLNDNSANVNMAPNGTSAHSYYSACFLVLQSELFNIPSGTNITTFGYTLSAGVTMAVTGNFTVFLQNTTDVTYQKGTTFSTALSGMTSVYASVMTIPVSATTTSVVVTLSSPFNYTGGGLYVAYDWNSAGPFNATGAAYYRQQSGLPLPAGGGGVFYSATAAPATMTLTGSRPAFLFGFANTHTNDVQVIIVEAPGKVPAPFNTPHQVKSLIRNASTVTLNNISVNLNVSGANTFNNSQTIASLAPGAFTWVTFSPFNPQTLGLNTLSVSVGSDQNNLNNSATYSQSVTCNMWSLSPAVGSYTSNSLGFNGGTGIVATPYQAPVSTMLTGLRGAVSTATQGLNGQVCGVLLDNVGTILATTNTLIITGAMQGTFQDFTFPAPQSLTGGTTYYFGFAQITASSFLAGTYPTYVQSTYPYVYTGITGGFLTTLTTNYGYLGIEGVFGSSSTNINVTSTPSVVCANSCATLSVTGLTSYTWSTGTANQTITACPAGLNSYSVAGTNTMGCSASAIISVSVNALPNITIATNTTAICAGAAASFTAAGASSYTWNVGPFTSTLTVTPTANVTYSVAGLDANGCRNTNSVNLTVYSLTVSVTPNSSICKGKNISLSASSTDSYSYDWLIGTGLPFATTNVSPTVTTTYTVNATDANGCTQSNTVMVTVNANPTVTAVSSKTIICKGESAVLTASGAATYSWSNNQAGQSVTVSPQTTTNYILTGTNTAGCTASTNISQVVNACTGLQEFSAANAGISVYPNPNNGWLTIHCDNLVQNSTLEIYNALGALVQQQKLLENTTTADLTGQPVGVYLLYLRQDNSSIQVTKIIKQ